MWSIHFSQQFGEHIRVLRTEGGVLRYTGGIAIFIEQKVCDRTVMSTWNSCLINAVGYIASPVRTKILLMITSSPSARLRSVVNEVVPGTELRCIGSINDEDVLRIWNAPMAEAPIFHDVAALILAIEPTIGTEPVISVES